MHICDPVTSQMPDVLILENASKNFNSAQILAMHRRSKSAYIYICIIYIYSVCI